jgi:hypothetical protein
MKLIKDVNKLQHLTGTLLYYASAVYPTLIMPINVLASEQSNATEVTADKVIELLNYCNKHPETKIRYHESDMILHIHSVTRIGMGLCIIHSKTNESTQLLYTGCVTFLTLGA